MRKYTCLKIVFVVALSTIFVVSAKHVATVLRDMEEADDYYSEIKDDTVSEQTPDVTTEPTSSESMASHEKGGDVVPISVDLSSLQAQYPDVIGWLYCEDTSINYPVAQGYDNNQYLRHLLNGTYNTAGTLFADYRNGQIGADHNFVIFGHNMNNGTMFGSIVKYKNQEYYEAHPKFYLFTENHIYRIELVAGYVTTIQSDAYTINFETEDLLQSYVNRAIKNSTFKSNVDYTGGNRIVTLSTCSYEFNNARYVVIGFLYEI
mgnify:CR=1 FL=1